MPYSKLGWWYCFELVAPNRIDTVFLWRLLVQSRISIQPSALYFVLRYLILRTSARVEGSFWSLIARYFTPSILTYSNPPATCFGASHLPFPTVTMSDLLSELSSFAQSPVTKHLILVNISTYTQARTAEYVSLQGYSIAPQTYNYRNNLSTSPDSHCPSQPYPARDAQRLPFGEVWKFDDLTRGISAGPEAGSTHQI